jgi:hypothetical protein
MSPSHRSSIRAFLAVIAAGTGLVASISAGHASDLRMTVEKPQFICERGGGALSHAAYHPGQRPVAQPTLPCCDGQLGCAQFLSTSTVLHRPRRWHS